VASLVVAEPTEGCSVGVDKTGGGHLADRDTAVSLWRGVDAC
jgi:hypothetical protein